MKRFLIIHTALGRAVIAAVLLLVSPGGLRAQENGGGEASWRERVHTPTLINQHSGILSFKLDPDCGKPTDHRVLFVSGPPTAADLKRMKAFPRSLRAWHKII